MRELLDLAAVKQARASGSALDLEFQLLKAALMKSAGPDGDGGERGLKITDEPDGSMGIYLSGVIGRDSTPEMLLDATKDEPDRALTLYVSSPGGLVHDGMQLANIIERHQGQTTAVADGLTGSAATIPFFTADKVEFSSQSELLLHEASASFMCAQVTAREMQEKLIPSLEASNKQMAGLYAKASGRTYDEIRALMREDRIMGAEEAVEYGFGQMAGAEVEARASLDLSELTDRIRPVQALAPERIKAFARLLRLKAGITT